MEEIEIRIEALTKMLGRDKEYDKGLLEGISALEDINEILKGREAKDGAGKKQFEIRKNNVYLLPAIQIKTKNPVYTVKNLAIEFHWLVFHARLLFLEEKA